MTAAMGRKKVMMLKLLEFKDAIKRMCDRYWVYVKIVLKFVITLFVLGLMNVILGYSSIMGNAIVIILISVLAAFTPDFIMPLAIVAVSVVQVCSVSVAMAAVLTVIYLIIYLLYVRFVPKQIYVLIAVPVLYILKIPYVIPLICGVYFAPYTIVSSAVGICIYYIFVAIEAVAGFAGGADIANTVNFFSSIVISLKNNKYMIFSILIFSIATCITYIVRRQKFNRASYVAILSGAVVTLVSFALASSLIENSDNMLIVIIGVLVSTLIAYIAQFFRMSLDYSGTKIIQFEDEEYYYYVKAVPKLSVAAEDVQVKTIHAQTPTSNTMNLKETIEKVFEESERENNVKVEENR